MAKMAAKKRPSRFGVLGFYYIFQKHVFFFVFVEMRMGHFKRKWVGLGILIPSILKIKIALLLSTQQVSLPSSQTDQNTYALVN